MSAAATPSVATRRGDALTSPCGTYRYWLSRDWGESPTAPHMHATWVMLNPSTADAQLDDPTIRRCIGFTAAWGYTALRVVNLFAGRAADPRDLVAMVDPIGPDSDAHILRATREAALVVAAWGTHPAAGARVRDLLRRGILPDRMHSLARSRRSGMPLHPLFLPGETRPACWPTSAFVS